MCVWCILIQVRIAVHVYSNVVSTEVLKLLLVVSIILMYSYRVLIILLLCTCLCRALSSWYLSVSNFCWSSFVASPLLPVSQDSSDTGVSVCNSLMSVWWVYCVTVILMMFFIIHLLDCNCSWWLMQRIIMSFAVSYWHLEGHSWTGLNIL